MGSTGSFSVERTATLAGRIYNQVSLLLEQESEVSVTSVAWIARLASNAAEMAMDVHAGRTTTSQVWKNIHALSRAEDDPGDRWQRLTGRLRAIRDM